MSDSGRTKKSVILFDGVCNLCNGFVQFVIDRDQDGYFSFTSLQGEFAHRSMLSGDMEDSKLMGSIILLENDKVYYRSTAILKIAKRLNGLWPLLYGLIIVPTFIRDLIYKLIAKNRYKWFGKADVCRISSPLIEGRFLE